MLSFRLDKSPRPGVGRSARALAGDEGGAVVLMCLAAVLILLLMSWLLYDSIIVSKDKIETQASADVAAFSQASVKARSMNMMAFSNIGKRSIVGVHSVYESMIISYLEWTTALVEACIEDVHSCDYELAEENRDLFLNEYDNDYQNYLDNRAYYVADVRALDNYQNYLFAITPWWGWSEAVTRAQRHGATLATSFPPPQGTPLGGFPAVFNTVLSGAGGSVGFNTLSDVESLPIRRGNFLQSMAMAGMADNELWREHQHMNVNVAIHRERSELGAAYPEVIERGASFGPNGTMTRGLAKTAAAMRVPGTEQSYAAAWEMKRYDNEARWLRETSNIVLTFHADPFIFNELRDKYHYLENYQISDVGRSIYQPNGYWGMARSEISFQGRGAPTLWSPSWTSRMRPVALPGEFRDAGYDLNSIYHASFTRLLLSGMMHENIVGSGAPFVEDLIYMERVSRGLGQTTIDGVGR